MKEEVEGVSVKVGVGCEVGKDYWGRVGGN